MMWYNHYDHDVCFAAEVGSSDLKFCSATYRLVKTAWESSSTHDPMVDVEYKGQSSLYSHSMYY